jgi:hypothetical protein
MQSQGNDGPTPAPAGAGLGGLRAHLVALVAAALLPAFAFGAIAVRAAVGSYRQAFEDRLEGTARALASAVETEVAAHVLALSTLATARSLDPDGDLAAFHPRARQVAAMLGTRIVLAAPDLSLLAHTHFPAGAAPPHLPQEGSAEVARRVFETDRPAVGGLLRGQVTGRWCQRRRQIGAPRRSEIGAQGEVSGVHRGSSYGVAGGRVSAGELVTRRRVLLCARR